MATDPVCGMAVAEAETSFRLVRENRTYYFCSSNCLATFAQPELQLRRLRRGLVVGWPAAVAVGALTYAWQLPYGWYAAFLLAALVQFYPGLPFYRGTLDAIRSRTANMDLLIAVGSTVAFAYSSAALFLPGRLPPSYYFDASALIITLILTGNYLELLTRERARGSLRELDRLRPARAHVDRDGHVVEVGIGEIVPGDRVVVGPGDRYPADGIVLEGRSSTEESMLSGERTPVAKGPGDRVTAGTVNLEGNLVVRAEATGEDTVLAEISRLVTEAETSRVPLQRTADRIASRFVPVVLSLAILAAVGWAAVGAGLAIALLVFVSVAITACPCAFGIATPAAIVSGTDRAASEGILFKGRDALEAAARVDTVLTDRTGTLTVGHPTLTDISPAPGIPEARLVALAYGLERATSHPLALAVVSAAQDRGIAPFELAEVRADPGRGMRGLLGTIPVAILTKRAAEDDGAALGDLASPAADLDALGRSYSVVTEAGRPIGLLGFEDGLARGAREAVGALLRDGRKVVMVTGASPSAAARVARETGISEVHAGVLPAEKVALIQEARRAGATIAFVGDGINDAAALAAADVGIAIGAGTDVAKEAGGIVLVRRDLAGVPLALRIAQRTVAKVRQNLRWALAYNAVLLPVAAGALVPVFGYSIYQVLPITGALAMGLSSTTVVLNSLSLRLVSLAR